MYELLHALNEHSIVLWVAQIHVLQLVVELDYPWKEGHVELLCKQKLVWAELQVQLLSDIFDHRVRRILNNLM